VQPFKIPIYYITVITGRYVFAGVTLNTTNSGSIQRDQDRIAMILAGILGVSVQAVQVRLSSGSTIVDYMVVGDSTDASIDNADTMLNNDTTTQEVATPLGAQMSDAPLESTNIPAGTTPVNSGVETRTTQSLISAPQAQARAVTSPTIGPDVIIAVPVNPQPTPAQRNTPATPIGAFYKSRASIPNSAGNNTGWVTIPASPDGSLCSGIYFTVIGSGGDGEPGNSNTHGTSGASSGGVVSGYLDIPENLRAACSGKRIFVTVGERGGPEDLVTGVLEGAVVHKPDTAIWPSPELASVYGFFWAIAYPGQYQYGSGYTWNLGDYGTLNKYFDNVGGTQNIGVMGGIGGKLLPEFWQEQNPLYNYYYNEIRVAGQGGDGSRSTNLNYSINSAGRYVSETPTSTTGRSGFVSLRYVFDNYVDPNPTRIITKGPGSIKIPAGVSSLSFTIVGGGGAGASGVGTSSPGWIGGCGGNVRGTINLANIPSTAIMKYLVGGGGDDNRYLPGVGIPAGTTSTGDSGDATTLQIAIPGSSVSYIVTARGGFAGAKKVTNNGVVTYERDGGGGIYDVTNEMNSILRVEKLAPGIANSTVNDANFFNGLHGCGGPVGLNASPFTLPSGTNGAIEYKFNYAPPANFETLYADQIFSNLQTIRYQEPAPYDSSRTQFNYPRGVTGTIRIPPSAVAMEVFMIGAGGGGGGGSAGATLNSGDLANGGDSGDMIRAVIDVSSYAGNNIAYNLGYAGSLSNSASPSNGLNGGNAGLYFSNTSPSTVPNFPNRVTVSTGGFSFYVALDITNETVYRNTNGVSGLSDNTRFNTHAGSPRENSSMGIVISAGEYNSIYDIFLAIKDQVINKRPSYISSFNVERDGDYIVFSKPGIYRYETSSVMQGLVPAGYDTLSQNTIISINPNPNFGTSDNAFYNIPNSTLSSSTNPTNPGGTSGATNFTASVRFPFFVNEPISSYNDGFLIARGGLGGNAPVNVPSSVDDRRLFPQNSVPSIFGPSPGPIDIFDQINTVQLRRGYTQVVGNMGRKLIRGSNLTFHKQGSDRGAGGLLPLLNTNDFDYYGKGGDASTQAYGNPDHMGRGVGGIIAYQFYTKLSLNDPNGRIPIIADVPIWHTFDNSASTSIPIPSTAVKMGIILVGSGNLYNGQPLQFVNGIDCGYNDGLGPLKWQGANEDYQNNPYPWRCPDFQFFDNSNNINTLSNSGSNQNGGLICAVANVSSFQGRSITVWDGATSAGGYFRNDNTMAVAGTANISFPSSQLSTAIRLIAGAGSVPTSIQNDDPNIITYRYIKTGDGNLPYGIDVFFRGGIRCGMGDIRRDNEVSYGAYSAATYPSGVPINSGNRFLYEYAWYRGTPMTPIDTSQIDPALNVPNLNNAGVGGGITSFSDLLQPSELPYSEQPGSAQNGRDNIGRAKGVTNNNVYNIDNPFFFENPVGGSFTTTKNGRFYQSSSNQTLTKTFYKTWSNIDVQPGTIRYFFQDVFGRNI
jgi:hypothetical protein